MFIRACLNLEVRCCVAVHVCSGMLVCPPFFQLHHPQHSVLLSGLALRAVCLPSQRAALCNRADVVCVHVPSYSEVAHICSSVRAALCNRADARIPQVLAFARGAPRMENRSDRGDCASVVEARSDSHYISARCKRLLAERWRGCRDRSHENLDQHNTGAGIAAVTSSPVPLQLPLCTTTTTTTRTTTAATAFTTPPSPPPPTSASPLPCLQGGPRLSPLLPSS
jgi:hypothetical protein